ncbi:DNA-3-methyladenine glycosylase I [Lacticaseibacillus brantae]|uniref:DNA-3-methyladenine glycosylase I n=1 Tax=Lacticaseibacillus brantae DSM 23927 TaxID=1423727 RepID=A0A0R2AXZ5_9LACO|nr:DNA-3-methyladenine glycosylase I [Lacticaseibacillus brantae]KRM71911.1 DNA-3-methyladenine glycosylase I [Lacticaseibacillus brantae DSM 23927]
MIIDGIKHYDAIFGTPTHEANKVFEFLVVAVFQAGLSWKATASKLPVFQRVFADFDYRQIAAFDEPELEKIEGAADMIRNDRKIRAILQNAQAAVNLEPEFTDLADYFWSFQTSDYSDDLGTFVAKDMKKRGFKFVGPKTIGILLIGIGVRPRL